MFEEIVVSLLANVRKLCRINLIAYRIAGWIWEASYGEKQA
ncbi:hypothetical protein PORCAN_1640 [Porphyromonas crevioricanis JCM 13913]|nr:hypothetical protein PORCAN_1640 [Porphyromonas crevioricanis JCM 13913]